MRTADDERADVLAYIRQIAEDGMAMLSALQQSGVDVPTSLVGGIAGIEAAAKAFERGAHVGLAAAERARAVLQ